MRIDQACNYVYWPSLNDFIETSHLHVDSQTYQSFFKIITTISNFMSLEEHYDTCYFCKWINFRTYLPEKSVKLYVGISSNVNCGPTFMCARSWTLNASISFVRHLTPNRLGGKGVQRNRLSD